MIKGDLHIILLLIDKKFLNFTDSLGIVSSSSSSVTQSPLLRWLPLDRLSKHPLLQTFPWHACPPSPNSKIICLKHYMVAILFYSSSIFTCLLCIYYLFIYGGAVCLYQAEFYLDWSPTHNSPPSISQVLELSYKSVQLFLAFTFKKYLLNLSYLIG